MSKYFHDFLEKRTPFLSLHFFDFYSQCDITDTENAVPLPTSGDVQIHGDLHLILYNGLFYHHVLLSICW